MVGYGPSALTHPTVRPQVNSHRPSWIESSCYFPEAYDRNDKHCLMRASKLNRAISTGKLHALLRFHTRPINVVVFHGSRGSSSFEVGFPLRCFQRLSRPYIATLLCRWRDNRSTRGTSIPVLSYWGQLLSKLLHPRQIGTELSHDVLNPAHVPL